MAASHLGAILTVWASVSLGLWQQRDLCTLHNLTAIITWVRLCPSLCIYLPSRQVCGKETHQRSESDKAIKPMMDSIKPFMSSGGAEDCGVPAEWICVWIKGGWAEGSYCACSGSSTQYLKRRSKLTAHTFIWRFILQWPSSVTDKNIMCPCCLIAKWLQYAVLSATLFV